MLDAIECNAKGNGNFATKSISTENVQGKSSSFKKRWKKEEERVKFLFSLVITLGD